MTAPLLRARDLVKVLGGRTVVDGVSLSVEPGQILGLLGPNGAGKTTTLRMCYGFLRPARGTICFGDVDVTTDLTPAKRHIGVCTQDDTADGDFTVRQNLHVTAGYFRPRVEALEARVDELLARFDLTQFADMTPDKLSGGFLRRLLIARALVHRPKVLFLDEPTTGLDPGARMGLWRLVDELRTDGLGIVLTTHYMDEAERLADRLVVLQDGRVIAEDSPAAVLGDLLGEHIVVCRAGEPTIAAWLRAGGRADPPKVLDRWHLALDADGLASFTVGCGEADFEVRRPNLDDLFLHLEHAGSDG